MLAGVHTGKHSRRLLCDFASSTSLLLVRLESVKSWLSERASERERGLSGTRAQRGDGSSGEREKGRRQKEKGKRKGKKRRPLVKHQLVG